MILMLCFFTCVSEHFRTIMHSSELFSFYFFSLSVSISLTHTLFVTWYLLVPENNIYVQKKNKNENKNQTLVDFHFFALAHISGRSMNAWLSKTTNGLFFQFRIDNFDQITLFFIQLIHKYRLFSYYIVSICHLSLSRSFSLVFVLHFYV